MQANPLSPAELPAVQVRKHGWGRHNSSRTRSGPMDVDLSRQVVHRFESIAERCMLLAHDLADLQDLTGSDSVETNLFLPCANQVGDLSRRFEALAAVMHRLNLPRP